MEKEKEIPQHILDYCKEIENSILEPNVIRTRNITKLGLDTLMEKNLIEWSSSIHYEDERITVEYQYRKNEILNVQERAKFNEMPSLKFSEVAKIQLANINLMYKLGTLKLPKMVKKYRSGKVIEQQATFDEMTVVDKYHDVGRIVNMTPQWDTYTPELSYWQNDMLMALEQEAIPVNNWFDELP